MQANLSNQTPVEQVNREVAAFRSLACGSCDGDREIPVAYDTRTGACLYRPCGDCAGVR